MKLILGLIRSLIDKYQVRLKNRKLSPKKVMLGWVNALMPEMGVANFTTHWNSGIALSALIEHIEPGLCPNYASLNPNESEENCEKAMTLAEKHFNIPKVLDSTDLANPMVDDVSVMTYVSYFCEPYSNRLLAWVQRKIPQYKVSNFTTDWNNGIALSALVDAVRPGLISNHADLPKAKSLQNAEQAMKIAEERLGVRCLLTAREMTDPEVDQLVVMSYITQFQTATLQAIASQCRATNIPDTVPIGTTIDFDVDATQSGEGLVDVVVKKPNGDPCKVNVCTSSASVYDVTFTPIEVGQFEVTVSLNNEPITGMPRKVSVYDSTKCAFLKPLPKSIAVDEPFAFSVDTSRAGEGTLDVNVMVKETGLALPVDRTHNEDAVTVFSITPFAVGRLVFDVKFATTKIPGSPFSVAVCDRSKVAILGTSLLSGKAKAGQPVDFTIQTKDAGNTPIEVEAKGPTAAYAVTVSKNPEDATTYTASFVPWQIGSHTVKVLFGRELVGDSPYTVDVYDLSKVAVYGPRFLSGQGKLNEPVDFTVHTKDAGAVEPNIEVRGPSAMCEVDMSRKEDDFTVFAVRFVPWQVGSHQVDVCTLGESVSGSPFAFSVTDTQCLVTGMPSKATIGVPLSFEIDVSGCGDAKVRATIEGSSGTVSAIDLTERQGSEGVYDATLVPTEVGSASIQVTLNKEPVETGPWTIEIINPSSCVFTERPLDEIQKGLPARLTVDITKAGPGSLEVRVISVLLQTDHLVEVHEEESGKVTATFTPTDVGQLRVEAKWEGQDIPSSPFCVSVCDATQVSAYGPGLATGKGTIGEPVQFSIQTNEAGTGKLKVTARGPTALYAVTVTKQDGLHTANFVPWEAGEHIIAVTFAGTEVPNSPYKLDIKQKAIDDSTIEASGTAIKTAFTGEEAVFYMQAQEEGLIEQGVFECVAQGVRYNADVELKDLGGGAYSGSYTPPVAGAYLLIVKCMNKNIPNSPFKVTVVDRPDPSKCIVEGAILTTGAAVIANKPVNFRVHTKNAGHSKLSVTVVSETGTSVKVFKAEDGGETYSYRFEPDHPGRYTVNVRWGDQDVPGSPFKMKIWPPPDASKVRVSGPGLASCNVGDLGEFFIDTNNAGLGTLLVRVHGIKDAFKIQLETPDKKNLRSVRAWYSPTQPGHYVTVIKWEGVEIPGSPFEVRIVDVSTWGTRQEPEILSVLSDSTVNEDSQMDVVLSSSDRRRVTPQHFRPPREARAPQARPREERSGRTGRFSIDVTAMQNSGAKMKMTRKTSEPGVRMVSGDSFNGEHPTPYVTSRALTLDDIEPATSMGSNQVKKTKPRKKEKKMKDKTRRNASEPLDVSELRGYGMQPPQWTVARPGAEFQGAPFSRQLYTPGLVSPTGYQMENDGNKKKKGRKKTKV